jgi:hypothetical protein
VWKNVQEHFEVYLVSEEALTPMNIALPKRKFMGREFEFNLAAYQSGGKSLFFTQVIRPGWIAQHFFATEAHSHTRQQGCQIFKPKIPIWVNSGGSCNGRCWCILCMAIWSF